jgi:hypothetical protein
MQDHSGVHSTGASRRLRGLVAATVYQFGNYGAARKRLNVFPTQSLAEVHGGFLKSRLAADRIRCALRASPLTNWPCLATVLG